MTSTSRHVRRAGVASLVACLLLVAGPAGADHKVGHAKDGKGGNAGGRSDGAKGGGTPPGGGAGKSGKPSPPGKDKAGGTGKGGTATGGAPVLDETDAGPTPGTSSTRTSRKSTAVGPLAVAGGDIRIDYAAAAQHTYDHLTGDGPDQFGAGVRGDQVVESLQGKDFKCGDLVLWYAAVTVDPAAVGTATIEIDISWSAEPSGQDGAGFTEVASAFINDNDSGNVNLDGNESVTLVSTSRGVSEGKQNIFGTIAVAGLDGGDQVIAAMLTRVTCWLPNPTGNLFSRIQGARMTAPVPDKVNVGAQTITLKRVEDLGNLLGGGPGTITIVKNAEPNAPEDFGFSGDVGAFDLDDDLLSATPSRRTFSGLAPGTYSVTEDVSPGWKLTAVECTDATGGTTTSFRDRRATVALAGGDEVVCRFTNTRVGRSGSGSGSGSDGPGDSDEDDGSEGPLTRSATKSAALPVTGGGFSEFIALALLLLLVGTSLVTRAHRRKVAPGEVIGASA